MPSEINRQEARQIIEDSVGEEEEADSYDHSRYFGQRRYLEIQELSADIQLRAQEKKEILDMRKIWSRWLLGVVVAIVAFDFIVIIAVGFHWMTFSDGYVVPFFIVESFLKTIGLAIIVVRFLFNNNLGK